MSEVNKIANYNQMMSWLTRPATPKTQVASAETDALKEEFNEKLGPGVIKTLDELPPVQNPFKDFEDRQQAAQGGVIGKDGMFKGEDMGTRKGFAEIKFDPNTLLSEMTDEEKYEYIQDLTKKQKIAAGLEKKRVSTKIDVYTDALNEYDKMVKEAFKLNDASKLPKPFAQFLNDKGLKSGTYFSLKNFDILPNIKTDVANLRLDLANKLIDESNNQLKFIEKEALLKKANFTFDQIKALSAMKSNTNNLDKAGDKARKAYDFIFKGSNNSFTDVKELFNPRAKIAELTGLTGETISKKFSVQTHDPEGYNIYTKLGNAKVQSAINKKQNPITFLKFKNTEGDIGSQAKATALRKERLDKAAKLAGEGVADINEAQDEVIELLNKHYKKNPEELLGNTKLRNILDFTLKDGEIVKKNKYVTDDDFLELIKKKKGLFTKDHVDEVQFEKLSTEFPIFRQLATYNTNSGLIKSMKSYISKNQNSKDPIIQNKIKKQIEFLQDLKLRIDTPTGRVGSKEVIAAVDRKAGILPNFLAQLKALDIKIPTKAKVALYTLGGIGATTLAQAEEVSDTPAPFPGIKPEGSPRQLNPEDKSLLEKDPLPYEAALPAGMAVGKYGPQILKALKNVGKIGLKTVGSLPAAGTFAGMTIKDNLDEGKNIVDATVDPLVGIELLLPEAVKSLGPLMARAARVSTPIGAGITAAGILKERTQNMMKEAETLTTTPYQEDLIEDYASKSYRGYELGGRVGFADGPEDPDKRKFMKIMGGLASLPIVGRLFDTAQVVEKAAPVVTEAAKSVPPYFFKLVEKIKQLGDDVTRGASTQDREVVTSYKDYMMTEDLGTGNIVIRKRNEGVFYDQDGIISDEYMTYNPGRADETNKVKPADEYDEYTVRPDGDGKLTDSEDGLDNLKEIMEEAGDPDSMTLKK